jgi:hypothetical protein
MIARTSGAVISSAADPAPSEGGGGASRASACWRTIRAVSSSTRLISIRLAAVAARRPVVAGEFIAEGHPWLNVLTQYTLTRCSLSATFSPKWTDVPATALAPAPPFPLRAVRPGGTLAAEAAGDGRMLRVAAAMVLALASGAMEGPRAPSPYAEGQVWEYRTRPGEEGSLLKIRRIEPMPRAPDGRLVYHVSIAGVRLGPPAAGDVIPHVPVSRSTLDASVTRLSGRDADFGDVDEGIALWREAQGGVFTISVAEIVDVAVAAVQQAGGR